MLDRVKAFNLRKKQLERQAEKCNVTIENAQEELTRLRSLIHEMRMAEKNGTINEFPIFSRFKLANPPAL